jgi:hypothetical protein
VSRRSLRETKFCQHGDTRHSEQALPWLQHFSNAEASDAVAAWGETWVLGWSSVLE